VNMIDVIAESRPSVGDRSGESDQFLCENRLFVADAERSLRFYTEELGFSLDWDSKDGVFQVSLFGFELILNQVGDRTRSRAGHGRVFIGLKRGRVLYSAVRSRSPQSVRQ
jgi:catechol 2,3-dioxygenase-like lactoylglutathione lyase family enzyme